LDNPEKPLSRKRIVVTRALEQSHELVNALESLGAEVLLLPTVAFAPPEDWQKLDDQLRQLDLFDAILFLSRNAVRYICDRCTQLGLKCEMLQSHNRLIGAVGPTTADSLSAKGLHVDYVTKSGTGEALARELSQRLAGKRVLLPRSDRGDDRVGAALREAGASVTEVVAYRTTVPDSLDPALLSRIRRADVDAILFASPSAFHNLVSSIAASDLAALSSRIQFTAIGPTTARALRDAGVRVEIEAEDTSASGLAESLARYYQRRSTAARPS
jgi:uroporphyrinogen-III synthase